MKYYFTPNVFNSLAQSLVDVRWKLLLWSVMGISLYLLLNSQIQSATPNVLVWVNVFIIFAAIQALVISAFIFFFQYLPSGNAKEKFWYQLYRFVEWSEAILFTILLPLPSLIFIFALVQGVVVT